MALLRFRIPPTPASRRNASAIGRRCSPVEGRSGFRLDATAWAVWIVTLTVCEPPFAAMDEGENVAIAPCGKPLAAKYTVPGKTLELGETSSW